MKKGFTVVELIVSFSLTMVIVVFLFQIVISLKNMYTANSLKTELLNKQAIISDKINSSFNKKTITNVTKCGSYCLNFVYSDNTSEILKIDYNENSFQFGSYKTILPDDSYISNPSIDIVYSGTFLENSNNSILVINIPIYNEFLKNQNYGINVLYQYNSNEYDLHLPGFNDNDGQYGYLKLIGERNLGIGNHQKYEEQGYKVFDSNGKEISDANVKVINPFDNMELPYQNGTYKIEYSLIHDDVVVETIYRYVTVIDTVTNFNYTGSEQSFIVPYSGYYKLEAWGAGISGGAYTSGIIYLEEKETLYVYVGQSNNACTPANSCTGITFNGGGSGGAFTDSNYPWRYHSGGGATDFRLVNGNWDDLTSLASRIMVAAGSGGGTPGGTLTGINGNAGSAGGGHAGGYGATQTSGGAAGGSGATAGTFGKGGNAYLSFPSVCNCNNANGGGGGYYGGGGGRGGNPDCNLGGGGDGGSGSSYISGYPGCIAIKSENDVTPKVTTYSKIEDSYHYSGKVFKNPIMIAGNEEMPTHDGTGTMIGNVESGYAKITYIGENLE